MTDIHSHLLFSVDDGSFSIEESLKLLKELSRLGFTNVILTPHYIGENNYTTHNYNASNEIKEERYKILKEAILENNIPINIYLGNEIFISSNIKKLISDNQIYGLNKSKYLLIELPFHNQILNLEDILYELTIEGYIPVIAHPERYTYFQNDFSLVDKLKEDGILFQCNYVSILDYYGKDAKKLLKYMLKKEYVDYLGTDLHHLDRRFVLDNFPKIIKHIKKITGENYFNAIMDNCNKLINK